MNATLYLSIPSSEYLDRNRNRFKLTGIIYIHHISDARFTGITRCKFEMFYELCGDSAFGNAIIVTNMWVGVSLDVGEVHDQEPIRNFFNGSSTRVRSSPVTTTRLGPPIAVRRIIKNLLTPSPKSGANLPAGIVLSSKLRQSEWPMPNERIKHH